VLLVKDDLAQRQRADLCLAEAAIQSEQQERPLNRGRVFVEQA
jgi:hypothetical protein